MKQLYLQQIEVSMTDGSFRLVMFPMVDGEIFNTPHLVGIMPDDDPRQILEVVKTHMTGKGYEWPDEAVLARALKHRELILADPSIQERNNTTRTERARIEAEQMAQLEAEK